MLKYKLYMKHFNMPFHFTVSNECLVTVGAPVWSVSSVYSDMCLEVATVIKCLATVGTYVHFLTVISLLDSTNINGFSCVLH